MKNILIVLPNCLFESNKKLVKDLAIDEVWLWEHPHYFTKFKYHKLKLTFLRAALKQHQRFLDKTETKYIEYSNRVTFAKTHKYYLVNPEEKDVLKKIKNIEIIESEGFINKVKDLKEYKNKYKKYLHATFYRWVRKRYNILITKSGKPVGGNWSFDKENRETIPEGLKIPKVKPLNKDKIWKEAEKYITKNFKNNYGKIDFVYPTTHKEAKDWFKKFLKQRFELFGPYEDAVLKKEPFLFHSVLSPLINIGLLTPAYVVKETIKYADKNKVDIASLEGFIRQIIGWREYVRMVYHFESENQKKSNYFNNKNKLSKNWYYATTGLEPIDDTIKTVLSISYCHHIQRLMYLGSLMLMCQIDPKHVYKWFMELFIDAYDWVMVPNIYGMSQYADGGLMMSRPYIHSGNYILKMSNYQKGQWYNSWYAIFYSFVSKNQSKLKKNYSTANLVNFWNKKGKAEKQRLLKEGEAKLKKLAL